KISLRARSVAARRRARESGGDAMRLPSPRSDTGRDDLRALLHEEVGRLPENERRLIVLCFLESLTHEEAARRLHWPVGTVKWRLARAKDRLRRRLNRRGLAWPTVALAIGLAPESGQAAVPPALLQSTIQAASRVAAGRAVAAGLISATVAALTEGMVHSMILTQFKGWAASAALGLPGAGAGVTRAQNGRRAADVAGPGQEPPRDDLKQDKRSKLIGFTKQKEVSSLAEQQAEVARQALATIQKQREVGTAPANSDREILWSRRLVEARRKAGGRPDDLIAALRDHAERLRAVE